jgi:tRNA(adenine34) deaminase
MKQHDSPVFSDEYFMKEALKEAQKAFEADEVPVGAVVVSQDRIIARAHNMIQQLKDVTAHAEMVAITSASNYLDAKYLTDCSIYVTLEPCVMCAAALKWAQVSRIVYGAPDPAEGYTRLGTAILHPATEVIPGILEQPCAALIRKFFLNRRDLKN